MKKLIVLYDKEVQYINTIKLFDTSFEKFSKYDTCYFDVNKNNVTDLYNIPNLDNDSIIILCYSLAHSLTTPNCLYKGIIHILKKIKCKKHMFIQDEYYHVNKIVHIINELCVDVIWTVLTNKDDIKKVYKNVINNNTIYVQCLTGYINENPIQNFKPIIYKTNDILYRGRKLHPMYGLLGYYKFEIGYKFKKVINDNNINLKHNISSDHKDRIYGDWAQEMSNAKITLATPSGSNVLNYDTQLQYRINRVLPRENSDLSHLLKKKTGGSYSDNEYNYIIHTVKKKVSIPEDLNVNALSPKMFEAIASGTVLVMLEGDDDCYSGILKPDIHYISLKRNYSNILDVCKKCGDNVYLQTMANIAFEDIVLSEKYSIKNFIKQFDSFLDKFDILTKKIYNISEFN